MVVSQLSLTRPVSGQLTCSNGPWLKDVCACRLSHRMFCAAACTQMHEGREGLMRVTYRDMANNEIQKHQWFALDGDIDVEWMAVRY